MTKQVAVRIQSVNCNVYDKKTHVRLVGGARDGHIMHISNADEYGLELEIDETRRYIADDKPALSLIDLASGETIQVVID